MGRPRKEADRWMPAKLYRGKSAYEYKPKPGVTIRVCSLDATKPAVLRQFAAAYEQFHAVDGSLTEVVELYFKSEKYLALALQTRKDYAKYWPKLKPVFGHVNRNNIKPEHIRRYMDVKGKTSETQANRHHSFLSSVYTWGFQRGYVTTNPCRGVSKFKEAPREKYIEQAEYDAVYSRAPIAVQVAMEISYLCAARQGDVLRLKKNQLLEEGIFIRQGKTGMKQIKAWTPRLRAAITLAATIETKTSSMYVIPTRSGTAYTSDGFRSIWHDAREIARKETQLPLAFTFHDIKAASISDYQGDKQRFSGHKTARQVQIYDRKVPVVDTLQEPENLRNITRGESGK
ncbi:MAG: integrase [unclassified Hahellaceae]|nr:integrase [Hahellaceae bacterium]|tara:strand:- start:7483 stop:8514 length:1032 start_codon:yes stop_codon:yes gene_type:complete